MSLTNRKLHMLRSNDGKNQEIWVAEEEWMRPRDIISEGSQIGPDHVTLQALITWLSCTEDVTAHALMTWLIGH